MIAQQFRLCGKGFQTSSSSAFAAPNLGDQTKAVPPSNGLAGDLAGEIDALGTNKTGTSCANDKVQSTAEQLLKDPETEAEFEKLAAKSGPFSTERYCQFLKNTFGANYDAATSLDPVVFRKLKGAADASNIEFWALFATLQELAYKQIR